MYGASTLWTWIEFIALPNIAFFAVEDDFSARLRLRWRGFFPPPGVSGTVMPPSDAVDVTCATLKQAAAALLRCFAVIICQASTVSLCLTYALRRTKSPTQHKALLASIYCNSTNLRRVSIRSGSCCGRQWKLVSRHNRRFHSYSSSDCCQTQHFGT